MDQLQSALNEIDQFWGRTNQKIIAEKGSRALPVSMEQAQQAVTAGVTSLGFERVNVTSTGMIFKAQSPAPFSEEEYEQIRIVEEPIMQAMASNHVGGFTSSFMVLTSTDTNTVLSVRFEWGGPVTTWVHLDFALEWIEGRQQAGLLLGENPPPEAVRRGSDKIWDSITANL
ncbi:MAG: hypothetical protein R3B95_19645 [Nitrospirales bacterium]|nr:hypothetical protein [Nitrospirales bacterium]